MSTVAEQLHFGREARNLSVYQVAEVTKIRTDHIRALEEGNFNVFSAPVYIRGFVRTYATHLKLDVPQVMAALDSELGKTQKFSEPPPLVEEPGNPAMDSAMLMLSKINWRKALVLLGIVIALFMVFSFVNSARKKKAADPLKDVKPAVYTPPNQNNSGETLPLPPPSPRK